MFSSLPKKKKKKIIFFVEKLLLNSGDSWVLGYNPPTKDFFFFFFFFFCLHFRDKKMDKKETCVRVYPIHYGGPNLQLKKNVVVCPKRCRQEAEKVRKHNKICAQAYLVVDNAIESLFVTAYI